MRLVPLIFCDQFDLDGHQCAAVRVHLKADVLPVLDSSVDEVLWVAWIGQSMAFIGSVIVGELRRLRLRWGNGFPLEVDYNGLVGGSPGGASVRSESAVALEVITCAK
jgi:hypothetical protein